VLLLADAREVITAVERLKARARLMTSGLEAELSVVVDVFFPTAVITAAAKAFAARFPLTPLRLFVEGLGAAYQPVLEGRCSLGILANLPVGFPSLVSERLGDIPLVAVAAAGHPLAALQGRIPRRKLARHVQLVLTDRSELMQGRDYGVTTPSNWRLADLSTKHAFLKDGVGWGNMPLHLVEADIASGTLVQLDTDDMPHGGMLLQIAAVHTAAVPPGPAGRWLVEQISERLRGAASPAASIKPTA
jgi:DNA-binding transcriptional LysR family regulator